MKYLCDVHIPYRLVNYLKSQGREAIHVNSILDKWHTKDSAITKFADKNDYVIISKDVDFRNSLFIKGSPKKLIRIGLGNISTDRLIDIFTTNLEHFERNLKNKDCFIEIEKDGISVITLKE